MTTSFMVRILAFLLILTPALHSAEPVPPDDTARFLAGLPPPENSPLSGLTGNKVWMEYAGRFNNAWAPLEARQLSRIRAWGSEYLGDAFAKPSLIYYMFSGPDFLYADAFYPNGATYVLCGIEPVGPLPDCARVPRERLGTELESLQQALNSVLSFGFFITKEMKTTLENHQLNGTLPLLYIFLARSGKVLHEVSLVSLDKTGAIHPDQPSATENKGFIPGVKIIFSGTGGSPARTLYYFCSNISDDGIRQNPGFLKFCQSLGPGNSLVKSASYLMHQNDFTVIRKLLLDQSRTLVEDDSGIPVTFFTPEKWELRLFGKFEGPVAVFKEWPQPELVELYKHSHPLPLNFGIGYKHYQGESNLILAVQKQSSSQN